MLIVKGIKDAEVSNHRSGHNRFRLMGKMDINQRKTGHEPFENRDWFCLFDFLFFIIFLTYEN